MALDPPPPERDVPSSTVAGVETLRRFVAQAPSEMCMFDRNMCYIAASRGWILTYRLPNEILGRNHYDLLPDLPKRWVLVHRRAMSGEIVSARDDRVEWADGRSQWIDWECRPWYEESGAIGGIVIYAQDNTLRQRATQEAMQSAALTSGILDSLPAQVCLIDGEGSIQRVNEGWTQLGACEGELTNPAATVGQNYLAICRRAVASGDLSVAPILAGIVDVLSGTRMTFEAEYPCHSPSLQRWFQLRVAPLKGASGAVISHVDISERKRAEQSLSLSYTEVRTLLKALESVREDERRRIAAELHDEFGQLLAAMRINAVWIERRIADPMPEVAARAAEIASMVDRARVATKRIAAKLRPRVLDDLGLVHALRAMVEEIALTAGLAWEFKTLDDEAEISEPQATALFRIAQESLTNVVKHAHASRVVVALAASENEVTLRVSDDGRGLGSEARGKVDVFGLLGMRERVAALGGKFRVSGAEGDGASVEVSLPRVWDPGRHHA